MKTDNQTNDRKRQDTDTSDREDHEHWITSRADTHICPRCGFEEPTGLPIQPIEFGEEPEGGDKE